MKSQVISTSARPATTASAVPDAVGPSPVRPEKAGSGAVVVTWAEYQRLLPTGSTEFQHDGRQAMPEAGEPVARTIREHTEVTMVLGFINEPMS